MAAFLRIARGLGVVGFITCFHANSSAQPSRIQEKIDDGQRSTMSGHVHRLARSLYDRGRADPYLRIERVTLVLRPSVAQAAELDRLIGELQYSKSGNYHQWLTPASYADRFGVSQEDIGKIIEWLTAHQLNVTNVARARNAIMVSGR